MIVSAYEQQQLELIVASKHNYSPHHGISYSNDQNNYQGYEDMCHVCYHKRASKQCEQCGYNFCVVCCLINHPKREPEKSQHTFIDITNNAPVGYHQLTWTGPNNNAVEDGTLSLTCLTDESTTSSITWKEPSSVEEKSSIDSDSIISIPVDPK